MDFIFLEGEFIHCVWKQKRKKHILFVDKHKTKFDGKLDLLSAVWFD